ncbi:MAG TPA: hypothetical protein VF306_03785 [Pirellulales bacterium]
MEVLQRDPNLLHVIHALAAPGRFARRLNRRQQQGDQNSDNRDHHEQFDQRETNAASMFPIETAHEIFSIEKMKYKKAMAFSRLAFALNRKSVKRHLIPFHRAKNDEENSANA